MTYAITFVVGSILGWRVGMWFTKKTVKGALQLLASAVINCTDDPLKLALLGLGKMCAVEAGVGSMAARVERIGSEVYRSNADSFQL